MTDGRGTRRATSRTALHGTRVAKQDQGSASVYVLALCAVLATVAATGVLLGQAVLARHRAGAAAELAALAAADRAHDGEGTACAVAGRVAAAAGGALTACALRDGVSEVATTVQLTGALSALGPARGRARAGPTEAARPPAREPTSAGAGGLSPDPAELAPPS